MSKNKVKKITDFSKQPPPVKKVKEQPVSEQITALDVAEVWVTDHWKQVLAGLAGVALIIVIVAVAGHLKSESDAAALRELGSAKDTASLERAIAAHKSNPAVFAAYMRLASLYIAEKNYAKAYDSLKSAAIDPRADVFFRTRAAIDCAGLLEMQGKYADAVRELEAVSGDMAAGEALRAEAAYNAARIAFAAGDKASAERLLASVNTARAMAGTSDPYAVWAFKAIELRNAMKAAGAPAEKAPAPAEKAPAAK